MFRLNNIKQNVLILSFATLLAGCGGGGTTSTDSTSTDLSTTSTNKVVQIDISAITTADSATIEWTPYGNPTKFVEYGTSNKYGSKIAVQTEGNVTLSHLQADTEYHYRLVSEDEKGRAIVSNDNTFTTLAATTQPIVTDTNVTGTAPTDTSVTAPVVVDNIPPTANAGPDKTVQVNNTITISGISSDSDGTIVKYEWKKKSNGQVLANTKSFDFTPTGTLTKTLVFTVTDDQGATASDEMVLTVTDGPIVTDTNVTGTVPTDTNVTEPIVTDPVPICQTGPAIQQGQVKDSISGTGLANVTVTINGCTTQTDAQGFYELKDIAINDRAVVTFELDGYYMNSEIIAIEEYSNGTTLSSNYLEFALDQYVGKRSYDSSNEAIWPYLTSAKAGITIPAGVYIDNKGNTYNGQIIGSVSYTGPTESRDVFPGTYEGKNSNDVIVPFVSYGFIVIDIEGENGAALNVTDDITLTFPSTSATADIIPLWYYDYAQGMWIEEGYATRLSDGTYQGFVSHPGTWSLSQPVEDTSGIYTDRILYPDGTPAKNLRVHAIGENWIRTDLTTDENGVFEIEVIPGKEFTLQAYHYDDKYSATYNGLISAVAPGEIINNSSL